MPGFWHQRQCVNDYVTLPPAIRESGVFSSKVHPLPHLPVASDGVRPSGCLSHSHSELVGFRRLHKGRGSRVLNLHF